MSKVSIIGAGNVGGLTALRIAEKNLASVCLIDVVEGLAQAKALDIEDSQSSLNKALNITGSTDFSELKGSDIVVITAGIARKPGMSREDLILTNSKIVKEVSSKIKQFCSKDTIVIVVTNPLDIITYIVYKELCFKREKVFGFGMNLDASRFANIISKKLSVSIHSIKPIVIAAHGQEMLPLPRFTYVNNKPLTEICSAQVVSDIIKQTTNRGAQIVSLYKTGSAYFAPSAGIFELVEIILKGPKKETLASCFLEGEYGVSGLCIGVPIVLSRQGIEKIIELELNPEEKQAFLKAIESVRLSLAK